MVRLKAKRHEKDNEQKKFQFHYGTIKRIDREAVGGTDRIHFNSIMVRLKEIMYLILFIVLYVISIPLWYD